MTETMGKGVSLEKLLKLPVKVQIGRMKEEPDTARVRGLMEEIDNQMTPLGVEA
jgi:hypothetical protein